WLAAREEEWPLAGVYEALGGRRGVDEVVEEASDPETMGRKSRAQHVVMSGSEDEDKSAVGPSVVVLGKQRVRDNSKDKDMSGPSKQPQSDGGRGESGGGVEGRGESGEGVEGHMVLCAPASSLLPYSRVFSPLSGRLDEAASLRFQNARLEAANLMLQVKVERQAAQYRMALCRLIELQRERHDAQDKLLHVHEVVGDIEDELARLWVHERHGSSAPCLVGLRRGAFQELADAGVQWEGEAGGSAQEALQDGGEVVGGGGPLPVDARTWAEFGAQWDRGFLADEDPDVLALQQ
ncbi:hypothetical protein C0992_008708, partial [Termitomyces sp. T32_za158]